MTQQLSEWSNYIDERIRSYFEQGGGTTAFPAIQGGTLTEANSGWYTVHFSPTFSATPKVLALQGARAASAQSQTLNPPKLPTRALQPYQVSKVSLASLQIPLPSTQQTWGQQAKNAIIQYCSSTIGTIPVIGGYLCSGIADTFGQLTYYFGNAMQAIHYATDLPALLSTIEQQAEAKAASDYDLLISTLQYDINAIIEEINSVMENGTFDINMAFSDLTGVAQQAINAFYGILNSAIGLGEGLSIPVAQIRNLYPSSVDMYHPGNDATIYWVAILV